MAAAVETMAYAGNVPWHGLGVKVEDTMTPEEMLEAAQLNWTVSKRPAYTIDGPTWSEDLGIPIIRYYPLAVKTMCLFRTRIPLNFSKSLFQRET